MLAGGFDRDLKQLLYDLAYLDELNEAMRRHLASEIDLTPPQLNILMFVGERAGEDGISVRTVAEHLHVSGAFITTEANKLERRRLVVRTPNPADGRSILLKLTPHAESRLRIVLDKIRYYNDRFFALIAKDDLTRLISLMDKLIRGGESVLTELAAQRALQLVAHRKSAQ